MYLINLYIFHFPDIPQLHQMARTLVMQTIRGSGTEMKETMIWRITQHKQEKLTYRLKA